MIALFIRQDVTQLCARFHFCHYYTEGDITQDFSLTQNFSVSPRINAAIKLYWTAASKYFEMDDTQTAAATIALDYAIAQRILPKLVGNGEEFEKWLTEFSSLCSNNGLNTSARMVKNIIERGNQQMKYYQFFC